MGSREVGGREATLVVDAIRRLVRSLRESNADAQRRTGISAAQLFVLQQLEDGSAIALRELAARTLTHPSSVSAVVQKLVDEGLVVRRKSAVDGRRVEISLTAAGRRRLQRAPRLFQEELIARVNGMSARRRVALAQHMQELVRGLDDRRPPMFFHEQR